jgi:DNA-binding NarL/FixJ family response regulator
MKIVLLENEARIDHICLEEINTRFPEIDVVIFETVENAIASLSRLESILICASRPMLTGDSIHVLRHIHRRLPGATVVVIRCTADLLGLVSLFANGATLPQEFAAVPMDIAITPRRSSLSELTERESSIMLLLSQGLQNKMIARRMNLAVPTVKTHMSNIFRKLGVGTRLDAVCKFTEASRASGGVGAPPPRVRGPALGPHWPLTPPPSPDARQSNRGLGLGLGKIAA